MHCRAPIGWYACKVRHLITLWVQSWTSIAIVYFTLWHIAPQSFLFPESAWMHAMSPTVINIDDICTFLFSALLVLLGTVIFDRAGDMAKAISLLSGIYGLMKSQSRQSPPPSKTPADAGMSAKEIKAALVSKRPWSLRIESSQWRSNITSIAHQATH